MSWFREPGEPDEHVIDAALDEEEQRAETDAFGHVPPSFAAIVARAHRIDPSAVSADAVERACRVTRTPRAAASHPSDDVLAPMIAALVADAERDIARQVELGTPRCGLLIRHESERRAAHARRWIAAISAVAAAALVVFGLDWLESWNARRHEQVPGTTQSVSAMRDGPVVHDAEPGQPEAPATIDRPRREPAVRVTAPTEPAVLPEEPAPLEAAGIPQTLDVPREAIAKVPADAALRRLDAQAQAALARGDRSGADELYARVISRGRRHPLAEIAFAERFSLARGRGTDVQRALWGGYLVKFPEGRFADDAHAGLCRTAAATDKEQCWRGYVDRFPAGAYRRHADRWFTSTATP